MSHSPRSATLFLIIAALVMGAAPVRAELVRAINAARADGCGGHPGVRPPLRSSAQLGEAARHLQRGESLRDAMAAAGYHSLKSTSLHMSGWLTDSAVARNVSSRFCSSLSDPQLTEIGFYRKERELWLILAQPFTTPALRNPSTVSAAVLRLANDARSHARRCGNETYASAAPLTLSPALRRAALEHSREMAARNYFEHQGRNGSQPAERVTLQGYKWRLVGENLAAGVTTPEEAVRGWLESPHHCANLMDPRFTEMGVAYAINPASFMGIYWTQVFALPRK